MMTRTQMHIAENVLALSLTFPASEEVPEGYYGLLCTPEGATPEDFDVAMNYMCELGAVKHTVALRGESYCACVVSA